MVYGSEDSTDFEMEVTGEQFDFLKVVAKKSVDASKSGLMPTIEVKEEL
jgi:hypothetical protein